MAVRALFDEGNQRPTRMYVRPWRFALYSSMCTNADHPASCTDTWPAVCTDVELREVTGEPNHVHLPVTFPPKGALSRLVNTLTGVSSRRMRHEFPELARHHHRATRLWSASHLAGPVRGTPLTVHHHYIEQQNQPA